MTAATTESGRALGGVCVHGFPNAQCPDALIWSPANNGTGTRRWFLARPDSVPLAQRYYEGSDGRLVRYASYGAAKQAANRLNAAALSQDRTRPVEFCGVCGLVVWDPAWHKSWHDNQRVPASSLSVKP